MEAGGGGVTYVVSAVTSINGTAQALISDAVIGSVISRTCTVFTPVVRMKETNIKKKKNMR